MMRWDELARRVPKGSIGVEVGVWDGKNASRLLALRPDVSAYLVDRWKRPEPGDSFFDTDSTSRHSQATFDQMKKKAQDVARRYADRCWIIEMASLEAAAQFKGPVDWVFVDGDHSAQGVTNDLNAWSKHVRSGGLLCGHDYGRNRKEVKPAVDAWIAERGLSLKTGADDTYFIQMP